MQCSDQRVCRQCPWLCLSLGLFPGRKRVCGESYPPINHRSNFESLRCVASLQQYLITPSKHHRGPAGDRCPPSWPRFLSFCTSWGKPVLCVCSFFLFTWTMLFLRFVCSKVWWVLWKEEIEACSRKHQMETCLCGDQELEAPKLRCLGEHEQAGGGWGQTAPWGRRMNKGPEVAVSCCIWEAEEKPWVGAGKVREKDLGVSLERGWGLRLWLEMWIFKNFYQSLRYMEKST